MKKHAYLIMAHNELYVLEKLLMLIDNEKNDIYLHIDKKLKNFDFDYYKNILRKSNLYYVKRMNVKWGTVKQIQCEMLLLDGAVKKNYSYYHFISGVDLPIKDINKIYTFFEKSQKEFIGYDSFDKELRIDRIKYYSILGNYWRVKNEFICKASKSLRIKFVNFQKELGVNRVKNSQYEYRKGPNWFSITNNCAKYILSKKSFVKEFKYSYCADELFVQTLVYNSKYKKNLFLNKEGKPDTCRYVDWNKGNPAILKQEDYNKIMKSNYVFARKFSSKVDKSVIDNIFNKLYII